MTEALTDAPTGPETDTLGEQVDAPKPITNTIPESEDPKPAEKLSADDQRKKAVNDAIDKAMDDKPDDAPKAKEKPKVEPKADDKAEVDDKEPKEADTDAKPEGDEPEPAKKPSAYRDPPSGFDEAAKGEWEAVPESVRGAVHRRAQEMERGIEKYRADAQEYDGVRQYSEMAKQSGTDLPTALRNYTQMEQQLRQDPITGLQAVVANLGMKKPDGSPVTLRDFAARIMGQSPDEAASRQEATISRLTQQLQEVTQKMGGFSQHVEQQNQSAKVQRAETEWGSFQREYPRATELEPLMGEFLTKFPPRDNVPMRETLADAYSYAIGKSPQSVAHTDPKPLVQTQTPPAPNPAGQKSISGAPGGNDAKTVSRKLSRSASIEKAMRSAGI